MSVGTKNYQKLTGCRINDVSPSPCCSKKVTINRTDHAVLIMIDKPAPSPYYCDACDRKQ